MHLKPQFRCINSNVMKNILCIGEALIDMICTDKGKLLSEGANFLKKPGGAPTNVAAAIAAFGGQVALCAKVGNDPFGKQLVGLMQSLNVATPYIFYDDHHFTTMAFVSLMESGERDFVFNRGADAWLSTADLALVNTSDYSIFHFGSATAFLEGDLGRAYDQLLLEAVSLNKFISFDPNYRNDLFKNNQGLFIDQSKKYLAQCDFAKLSDEEAMLISGCSNVADSVIELGKLTKAVICITIGKAGTLFHHQNTSQIIPSIPVKVIDTTGAGDAFVGAVLYQLSEKKEEEMKELEKSEWEKIIANANKAGARTCEYLGAMEAFIHLSNQIFY